MRTLAIVQVRMGSTRLPGKSLLPIKGKPLLSHVLARLKQCLLIDHIIVATTTKDRDQVLLDLAKKDGMEGFAGSEDDVLDRYYHAARRHKPEHVVRCTGDCPMLDPELTDDVIRRHLEAGVDYTCNTVPRSFPRGYDTEVMTFAALKKAAGEAKEPYEREHVTPYIFEHPDLFRMEQVIAEGERFLPDLRLTVDTEEDLALVRTIFDLLYAKNPHFGIRDVLDLLKKEPKLREINSKIQQKPMRSET